ncbi:MarR family winged helix-turn-helix transcriptional regulator [Kribbella solani]|uniref:DNA-binding MarR family transcriptional regulator n=1 Tax=Kribbella solani TaxID=236067 RepID=A0A841DJU5_9ACTN|nr:MarR family transcriptional regulator [Kribbella solani]MBB5976950.1 DNA-binding MarR family transcriptional regulator [Kribbella solani]MDX2970675.1 MarR family transcriptional regulator [Kribbella solani]MDX3002357.1 MarR family transcriptional regulator [Kribbella solani]
MSERLSASAGQAASQVRVVFGRVKRRLNELAETDDLTPSQSSVLSRIDKDGPASASELAAAERIRPQSIAAILTALREADLIQRHPDPADGRRQVVSLTTSGRRRLQGDRKVRQEWLTRTLQDHCTEAERQTIIKALALLDHAIEAATPR